jgi:hypothetical protein
MNFRYAHFIVKDEKLPCYCIILDIFLAFAEAKFAVMSSS